MSNHVSGVASSVRDRRLPRLAALCASMSIAAVAGAQTVLWSDREVTLGTSTYSTAALGPWTQTMGPDVWQISNVQPTHISASGHAYLYGGDSMVESMCAVQFRLTEPTMFAFSGTLLGYSTLNGLPAGEGDCAVVIAQDGIALYSATGAQAAPFNASVPFSVAGLLLPGDYYIGVVGGAWGSWPATNEGGYADFNVTFDWTPVCGGSLQSCFTAHGAPGCIDQACCSHVCDGDPFCCETAWDAACALQAEAACTPAYVTGPIINPWNGHRHRLLDATYWADSLPGIADTAHGFVTIHSALENRWVRDALLNNIAGWTPAPAFIGLSDVAEEGTFVWSSGEPFTFADWYTGEPNDLDGEDVVEMSPLHGRWNDISSSVTRAAVTDSWRAVCGSPSAGDCYEENSTKGCSDEGCCNAICDADAFCCDSFWDEICASQASSFCRPTVIAGPFRNPSTGHRYYVLSQTSWSLAERTARELGGHLATLNSAAEATWLAWAVSIGLGVNNYAIGFDDQAVAGSFRWADGAPAGYTAWRSGQPSLPNVAGRVSVGSDQLWSEVPIWAIGSAVVEAACLGDTTLDGVVNGADLAGLLGAWGTHDPSFDLTFDGVVDAADLSIMLGAWGTCLGGPACVVHAAPGSQQPGCDSCVCGLDPSCCEVSWDAMCVYLAKYQCPFACQCP